MRHKVKCDQCDEVSYTDKDLKIHKKQMHEFKCNDCEYTDESNDQMMKHKEEEHNRKKEEVTSENLDKNKDKGESNREKEIEFMCDNCEFKSKSMVEAEKHSKMKHLKCDKCDFKTVKKTILLAHKGNNHSKMIKCDKCEFTNANSRELNKHKAEEHTKKINCSICDKPKLNRKTDWECFTCKSQTHNECMKVLGKERLEEFKSGKKQYNCVKCKEKFCNITFEETRCPDPEVIEIQDVYECTFCQFSTDTETSLDIHKKNVHEPAKEIACKKCKLKFKTHIELKVHNEKDCSIKCSICAETFETSELFKSHNNCHTKLVEDIVSNVEKHLEDKCKKLEETLAAERLANEKNIAVIEELKLTVKKADDRTRKINVTVIAKDKELDALKDNIAIEICENEQKTREIEDLKNVVSSKEEEIIKLKSEKSKKDNNQSNDDVAKLTQKLEETRDLCLEYKNKIEIMKKENTEEVNKIATQKIKVEEELRTALLEKNLLRDTERILLNTFDTLKMHYDEKKKRDDNEGRKKTDEKKKDDGNKHTRKEKMMQCDRCDYKTDKEGNLRAHIINAHDPLYENGYSNKERQIFKCNVCDYKTPFVANLNIHREEVHNKEERPYRRHEAAPRGYSDRARNANGYCRNWNRGFCSFEKGCKFLHEDAPACYYGDRCRRKSTCRFFHEELFRSQSQSFLGQGFQQAQWGM